VLFPRTMRMLAHPELFYALGPASAALVRAYYAVWHLPASISLTLSRFAANIEQLPDQTRARGALPREAGTRR